MAKFKDLLTSIAVIILLMSSALGQSDDQQESVRGKNVYVFLDNSLSLMDEQDNIASRLSELFVAKEDGFLGQNDTVYFALFGEGPIDNSGFSSTDVERIGRITENYRNQPKESFNFNTDFNTLTARLQTILTESAPDDVNVFIILSDFIHEESTSDPCGDIFGDISKVNTDKITYGLWSDGALSSKSKNVVRDIENFPKALSSRFKSTPGKRVLNTMFLINVDEGLSRNYQRNSKCIEEYKKPQADYIVNALSQTFYAQKTSLSDVINSSDEFLQALITNLTMPLNITQAKFSSTFERPERFLELKVENMNNQSSQLNSLSVEISGSGDIENYRIPIANGKIGGGRISTITEIEIEIDTYNALERALKDDEKTIIITDIEQVRQHSSNLTFVSTEIEGTFSELEITSIERELGIIDGRSADFFTINLSGGSEIKVKRVELGIRHDGLDDSETLLNTLEIEQFRDAQEHGFSFKVPESMEGIATKRFIIGLNLDGHLIDYNKSIARSTSNETKVRKSILFLCALLTIVLIYLGRSQFSSTKLWAILISLQVIINAKDIVIFASDRVSIPADVYKYFTAVPYELLDIASILLIVFLGFGVTRYSEYINKKDVPNQLNLIVAQLPIDPKYEGLPEQKIGAMIRARYLRFFMIAAVVAAVLMAIAYYIP